MSRYTDEAIDSVVRAVTLALNNGGNIRAGVVLGLAAADTAMEAAGWVRVPAEPTEAMLDAAVRKVGMLRDYRAMIAARGHG